MIIRNYSDSDFSGVVKVIRAVQVLGCWPEVFPGGWNEERIKKEFAPLKRAGDSLFLVAEASEGVVGLIAGQNLRQFIDDDVPHLIWGFESRRLSDAYYQRDIIVSPQFQRSGIGLRLFNAMKKFALERGFESLVTRTPPQNVEGISFFKKMGYTELFRDNNPERVYFSRELKPEEER